MSGYNDDNEKIDADEGDLHVSKGCNHHDDHDDNDE